MKKIATIVVILTVGLLLFSLLEFETPEEAPELKSAKELKEASSAISNFSFKAFSEMAEGDENLFISPYSIHAALSMAYLGSDGETKKELTEALEVYGIESEQLKEDSLALKQYLEYISDSTEVNIANALFLKEGIPFLQGFREDAEIYFQAEVDNLPTTGEPINDWVYEKTREKIDEIIDSGPIDDNVIAYLVNAIYFQGNWEEEFDEEKTIERPFYGSEEKEVEMMENRAEYRYVVIEDLKAVTLEYEGGDYLFHAFMPENMSEFYESFNIETFRDIKPTNKGEIVLRLPKFTLEDDLKLKKPLMAMGIREAFDPINADFSKMVNLEKTRQNVFMSEVFHSSFIEVDEKGTEAAAATAVEMKLESMPMSFEFNRPFVFVIEQAETETILFLGQLVDPS